MSIRIVARTTDMIAFLVMAPLTEPLMLSACLIVPFTPARAFSTLGICESSPLSVSSTVLNTISFVPATVCTEISASLIPAASAITGTMVCSASERV